MRNKISLSCLLILILLVSADVFSQVNCLMVKDSITAGSRATSFSNYYYDGANLLIKVAYTDTGNTIVTGYDTLSYNGSGQYVKLERYYTYSGTPYLYATTDFTYTSGKITRMDESGSIGGTWTKSFDLTYDSNGKLQSIILDPLSVTGNPEGFKDNVANIVWQNGNIVSVDLILQGATIELNVTYDNKNNLARKLLLEEVMEVLEVSSANNITQIVFAKDETMGPAGTVGVNRVYTYNANNDVETLANLSGAFQESNNTTKYYYDCSTGINEVSAGNDLKVYPDPCDDYFNMEIPVNSGVLTIHEITGREVKRQTVSGTNLTINMHDIAGGIYFIEVRDGANVYHSKVLKK